MTTKVQQLVDELLEEVIPIYTAKNLNPVDGSIDCPIKKMHKDGKRYMMRDKIMEVIKRYDQSAKDKEQ